MRCHFKPQIGWMNDPNGLIYYKGKYHAFFQHNPHDIVWGPMHWGHATSENLTEWDEHEIALYPDQAYENDGGCFSGSAIEKDGRLYLIYTSVSKEFGQAQSVAWSDDGMHFTKYDNNPVIKHFPKDATGDFRDPKVFRYNDEYRMIVGTKYEEHGRIVQYRSKDLLNWDYMGILYDDYEYSNVIECPDLYQVNDQWILMYSLIGKKHSREQFVLGDYDGERFVLQKKLAPEFGPQFYAAQTFEANGTRILIGWLYDWDIKGNPDAKSAGVLTIPREVTSENGVLRLYPVKEARHMLETITIEEARQLLENDTIEEAGQPMEKGAIEEAGQLLEKGTFEEALCMLEQVVDKKPDSTIEILTDENTIEIFVNKGEFNISINRV